MPAVGLLTLGLLVGTLGLPAASASDTTLPAPEVESTDAATDALTEVRELADGRTETGRDLTMALRELRLHQDELSPTDRTAARRLLNRPPTKYQWASEQVQQFGGVLVHWDAGTVTPAYVSQVGTVVNNVLATYTGSGYRAPKSDGTNGGVAAGLLDIYLVDFAAKGEFGLYGYCDSDAPPPNNGPYDVSAYCAFDNDYAEYPGTPDNTLNVTAAHELFHAVQFAYDYEEDRWFLEATATWVEDELYDDVNDNWQYLAASPLRQPRQSLDQWTETGLRQYGEWIFFRYLSERWPTRQGALPVIMRRLMDRVDGAAGGPDTYSMRAIERELKARGTSLAKVYADFSDANRRPQVTYEEGASYQAAAPSATWKLSKRHPDTRVRRTTVNHLASATARLVPGAKVAGDKWRLRVKLDLPSQHAAAVISSYRTDGVVKTRPVRLDRHGRGTAVVRFDGRTVRYVEVTLVNTSARYRCWRAQPDARVLYSCRGKPRDQRQPMLIRARAIR
ncbi:hypothetical protein GON03_16210 [Nocardioides sp. MAH-18]|uniref:Uncharacterized protein n=1 Tax=Nocardioides agri TaxID=2682843 RepID=A0A6L6XU66_9ACTN|nr:MULTISPECIES: MXAN_6640 family putative metalloprotease [unclassified Nocardioides]MBA2955880.1 hypothetical protein [Nocardioides sp. CGMCC 1.13656]MVQ50729.1 hypothetical protein [Nocardioides sp. MAH-18]